MTDVSIIIPTYGRLCFLKRALTSLQSAGNEAEVVIVDDCSTDGTRDYLSSLSRENPNFVCMYNDSNKGVNFSRNRAIERASGNWVAFLDDDDEFLPGALDVIRAKLPEMPENFNVAFFNSVIDFGAEKVEGGFQFERDEQFHDPTYEETMAKYGLVGDNKPVFRKSLFSDKRHLFPASVNGFESYTIDAIARDGKGIRYFKEKTTLVHYDNSVQHLSQTAASLNPWPLFVLNFSHVFEHWRFYLLIRAGSCGSSSPWRDFS